MRTCLKLEILISISVILPLNVSLLTTAEPINIYPKKMKGNKRKIEIERQR